MLNLTIRLPTSVGVSLTKPCVYMMRQLKARELNPEDPHLIINKKQIYQTKNRKLYEAGRLIRVDLGMNSE